MEQASRTPPISQHQLKGKIGHSSRPSRADRQTRWAAAVPPAVRQRVDEGVLSLRRGNGVAVCGPREFHGTATIFFLALDPNRDVFRKPVRAEEGLSRGWLPAGTDYRHSHDPENKLHCLLPLQVTRYVTHSSFINTSGCAGSVMNGQHPVPSYENVEEASRFHKARRKLRRGWSAPSSPRVPIRQAALSLLPSLAAREERSGQTFPVSAG